MKRLLVLAVLAALAIAGVAAWRTQLVRVESRASVPAPLQVRAAAARPAARFDQSLPMVPVGVERVTPAGGVLLVHYWAPWQRHSGPQAVALDSLRRTLAPGTMRLAVVCFDPYPSVSRYVARMRLRLPVLLDLRHALADQLPCPQVPYTYVIDTSGRIAVEQPGEIDWLAPATRAALERLAAEPPTAPTRRGPPS